MYSSREVMIERPRLSNRGFYSDLDQRALYYRKHSYGHVENSEEEFESRDGGEYEASDSVDYSPPPVRPRSLGRGDIDIINRVEYRRAQQRPQSFGRIDKLEREELEIRNDVRNRIIRRTKSDKFDKPEDDRHLDDINDPPVDSAMHRSSMENLAAISSPANVRSFKDQETMIQEIKKENFDLKLRLYMEQKEREKLNDEFQQKIVVLETDLTESLDELSDALEREKDYEISLNNARRRERALMTKLRRYEETMREQDEEIKYLVETKSMLDLSQGQQTDASTQTERPGYYEERGVDIGLKKTAPARQSSRGLVKNTEVRSSSRSQNSTGTDRTDAGNLTPKQNDTKQPPEGVDLLSHETMSRKEEILGEARRRRTLKSKKDKQSKKALDEMPEVDQTQKMKKQKQSIFKKLLCCGSSKSVETDIYERRI